MANPSLDVAYLARLLQRRYRDTELDAMRVSGDDEILFRMQCRARGMFRIDGDLMARFHRGRERAVGILIDQLDALHRGIHTDDRGGGYRWRDRIRETTPLVECGHCKTSQPAPDPDRVENFEFAERQAVLWMERAEMLRKAEP